MKPVVTISRANHSLKPDRKLLNYQFEQYKYTTEISPEVSVRSLKHCPYKVSQSSDISYQATRSSCLFNHILVSPSGEAFYLSSPDDRQISLRTAVDSVDLCTLSVTASPLWNVTHRWLDERTLLLLVGFTLFTISLEKGGEASIHQAHDFPHPSQLLYDFTQGHEVYLVLCHKDGDDFPHSIIRYSDFSVVCTLTQTGIARFVSVRDGYLTIITEGKLKCPPASDEKEDPEDQVVRSSTEQEPPPPPYTWTQDSESVEVTLEIPRGLEKSDLVVEPTLHTLEVRTHGGQCLLDVKLFGRVEPENCTWSFAGAGKVEITLAKYQEAHNWAALEERPGFDHAGNLINSISDLSPADLQSMSARLASLSHLTSDSLDASPLYTPNADLEECDEMDGEPVLVQGFRFTPEVEGPSLQQEHLVELSPGCLLTTDTDLTFTLSHNVDACVYEACGDADRPWRHIRTCDALNTIQATKTQKKYIVSPSGGRYVAIVDISRNVYVYMGEEGKDVGRLFVVTVPGDSSEIVGVAALSSSILLLTEKSFVTIDF